MKQINNTALLIILLMWAVWCCFSVSAGKVIIQHHYQITAADGLKEQLSPEAQSKSVAWSEPTAPRGTSANAAEKNLTAFIAACSFCVLLRWLHLAPKSFKITLSFPTLSEQFRILPNAP